MTDPTRPATGYPAQAHHPPPPPTNSYYYPNHNPQYHAPPPPSYAPPRATFFRRFFAALLCCFIIIGTVLFIIWLVLRPRVPLFNLTSLTLSSLSLSSTSSPSLSATWQAHLDAYNPNSKLHVYYDQVEARIFYRSSFLAQNQLPPFDQGTRNLTAVNATLVAAGSYVDGELFRKISDERRSGNVKFDLQVLAIVRFKAGGWRARRRFLRVFCDDLVVAVKGGNVTSGTLSNGPRRCAVGI